MDDAAGITPLLLRAHRGDRDALDEIARRVHGDLLKIARRLVTRRPSGPLRSVTLDPAALVNETFVRLLQQRRGWANRKHFFAIATRVMLRVLHDYDRARSRKKRDGARFQVSLGALAKRGIGEAPAVGVPLLIRALDGLEALDPRAARVVKLRALWGLELDEIAEMLGVSRSTVDRDWRFGRAWLASRL